MKMIAGVPFPLIATPDTGAHIATDGTLRLTGGALSDLFVSPADGQMTLNATTLLGRVAGDFQLVARVQVAFASTFDAGALLVWHDPQHWAKLCYELSPAAEPMVVSVVTREYSDDANGFVTAAAHIWLRIARMDAAFAFHASPDGRRWSLVRHFRFAAGAEPLVGFVAQSPTGAGCTATFDEISCSQTRLAAIRDGS